MSWADFDRWLQENGIPEREAPEFFAQWLADTTGDVIVGGPVGEAPSVVAIPDDTEGAS
jgi:hypothetical protein